MIFRFCLYGFLKNQQYYEPFLILAFREKGLSFFAIGLLVGFRDLCVNLLEIPTGAAADVHGRRLSMVLSMAAFIVSFVVFALSAETWHLFVAMFLFAVGEAFRSGTHKAMVFEWIKSEGLTDQKTEIYGLTRSVARLGSALSVAIAAGLVFWRGRYSDVFWLCVIPYAANIVNLATYPLGCESPRQEGESAARQSFRVARRIGSTLVAAWKRPALRRLVLETTGFEGGFQVLKDYIQPTIKTAALALPVALGLAERERTALLVGIVYVILQLSASYASLRSGRLVKWAGDENRLIWRIWITAFLASLGLTAFLALGWHTAGIVFFVVWFLVHNFWMPAQLARINDHCESERTATVLSLNSQSKSLFAMALAPLLGLAVDAWGLWPAGALGLAVCIPVLLAGPMKSENR